ncbi:hypothetical protein ACSVDE_02570 [Pseudalkalibacillus sp. Hm43]|uniref:hypothetical protein n=1 Tax=Pseudalkalibacillus sp. Hm43 TaxID=3450742 RepID=UPI003F424C63
MYDENKTELVIQLNIVKRLIEEKYSEIQRKGVLDLIYKRYSIAIELLECREFDRNKLFITGGVRAYLDGYSDYDNPLLKEMHRAEELLESIN